jgi:hypothetical protein
VTSSISDLDALPLNDAFRARQSAVVSWFDNAQQGSFNPFIATSKGKPLILRVSGTQQIRLVLFMTGSPLRSIHKNDF